MTGPQLNRAVFSDDGEAIPVRLGTEPVAGLDVPGQQLAAERLQHQPIQRALHLAGASVCDGRVPGQER
jgi:hypothetical protein